MAQPARRAGDESHLLTGLEGRHLRLGRRSGQGRCGHEAGEEHGDERLIYGVVELPTNREKVILQRLGDCTARLMW